MDRLNRWLLRYVAAEALFLLAVGLTCLVVWAFSGPIVGMLNQDSSNWWNIRRYIEGCLMYPLVFAYYGNLAGAIATLFMLARGRPHEFTIHALIGHLINLAIVILCSWIVLAVTLDAAFNTIGRAID